MVLAGVVGMEVECPNCHYHFSPASPRGKGAQYVKEWDHIGVALLNMLAFWLSNTEIRTKAKPKSELLAYFNEKGYTMAALPFSGRISELVGLGLVIMQKPEIREGPDKTKSAPAYALNIDLVTAVLNKSGNLIK